MHTWAINVVMTPDSRGHYRPLQGSHVPNLRMADSSVSHMPYIVHANLIVHVSGSSFRTSMEVQGSVDPHRAPDSRGSAAIKLSTSNWWHGRRSATRRAEMSLIDGKPSGRSVSHTEVTRSRKNVANAVHLTYN